MRESTGEMGIADPQSFTDQRARMVGRQIASRGVRSRAVLEAMRAVPREEFVAENLREYAYEDSPLPIEEGQTISQPFIVGLMVEALELEPGDRVLEVGAGSGYAAAVLGEIAAEVFAIERYEELAELALRRLRRLGYRNVEVLCADGTLGLPSRAPFDAILVSAGGPPEVPPSLIDQLKVGGRLVIPIGGEPRTQELVRIRRTGPDELSRESLGRVQFVPLVGSEGWSADGTPVPRKRAPRPLRIVEPERFRLAGLIRDNCEPFAAIEDADIGPLLDRVGDARVVLLGEATHGTSEFYRMRARITRELVSERGFNILAIEGDWPDCSSLDRYVRPRRGQTLRTPIFSRFPTWMWRNREFSELVEWLYSHNEALEDLGRQVSIHGLDLYSLHNSIGAVLDYLGDVDPEAARTARRRYGCFTPWQTDPAAYGRAAVSGQMRACREEVVAVLGDILASELDYQLRDGADEFFDAERNATAVEQAERYYRVMYEGGRESWNLRDRHMFETLEAVLHHRGDDARAVVWAHNSHVGNAGATEMGLRGELNIGQLARQVFGPSCYAIGFGTDRGTVAAASNWDDPLEIMSVRPSHADSYERLCRESGVERFFLPLRAPRSSELREALLTPHLERAIGVIYRPDTEMLSHYFQAALPAQFDEYVWFDETAAVTPLEVEEVAGGDSTLR